jgi:predicted Rossmann fold flavoprotein
VTVVERGHILGRKVLASGGGRCNFTNSHMGPEHFHCARPRFIRDALTHFKTKDALNFFSGLGLLSVEESDGRYFPRCGKSQVLLDAITGELDRLQVSIQLGSDAETVQRHGKGFQIGIVPAPTPWQKGHGDRQAAELSCDRLILACGGASYPQLGAGQQAYELAKSLGHAVTTLSPALVPLCVKEGGLKRLDGIRLEASLRIFDRERKEVSRSQGEVLFTDYGLSGPAALDVSREAVLALGRGQVRGALNFFPEFSNEGLLAMLSGRWNACAKRPVKDFFIGMFPQQLSGSVIDALGWDAHRKLETLGRDAVHKVASRLSDWPFEVIGARPWPEAMTTAGGVNVEQVDPASFASRQIPGLFLTGEMLDVDGDSGGYNLHFAWASGSAAGRTAAAR